MGAYGATWGLGSALGAAGNGALSGTLQADQINRQRMESDRQFGLQKSLTDAEVGSIQANQDRSLGTAQGDVDAAMNEFGNPVAPTGERQPHLPVVGADDDTGEEETSAPAQKSTISVADEPVNYDPNGASHGGGGISFKATPHDSTPQRVAGKVGAFNIGHSGSGASGKMPAGSQASGATLNDNAVMSGKSNTVGSWQARLDDANKLDSSAQDLTDQMKAAVGGIDRSTVIGSARAKAITDHYVPLIAAAKLKAETAHQESGFLQTEDYFKKAGDALFVRQNPVQAQKYLGALGIPHPEDFSTLKKGKDGWSMTRTDPETGQQIPITVSPELVSAFINPGTTSDQLQQTLRQTSVDMQNQMEKAKDRQAQLAMHSMSLSKDNNDYGRFVNDAVNQRRMEAQQAGKPYTPQQEQLDRAQAGQNYVLKANGSYNQEFKRGMADDKQDSAELIQARKALDKFNGDPTTPERGTKEYSEKVKPFIDRLNALRSDEAGTMETEPETGFWGGTKVDEKGKPKMVAKWNPQGTLSIQRPVSAPPQTGLTPPPGNQARKPIPPPPADM